jgi:hypothetical protein
MSEVNDLKFWIWIIKVILSCLLSSIVGWSLVSTCRTLCRHTDKISNIASSIFITPICVFVFLRLTSSYGLCDRVVADSSAFGIVLGTLAKLKTVPTGNSTIKLIVQQFNGKRVDVWLDREDILVGEARHKISETLGIVPSRVLIESGKGKFIEDMSGILFKEVSNASRTTDFFGFITATCFISIKDLKEEKKSELDLNKNDKLPSSYFKSLLKSQAKYGDSFVLSAKINLTLSEKKAFHVKLNDKFVTASIANAILAPPLVRIVNWNTAENCNSETFSEIGDNISVTTPSIASPPSKKPYQKDAASEYVDALAGTPIKNGDTVVIETEGKYMNVVRGWWMGWSASLPRRSGAFVVEIIERAPQNIISVGFESIKDGVTGLVHGKSPKVNDDILRTGDMFRLRSVKFPEYELGLTSVKSKEQGCYMALRKINSSKNNNSKNDKNETDVDDWCLEVRFQLKMNSLSTEMFKLDPSKMNPLNSRYYEN